MPRYLGIYLEDGQLRIYLSRPGKMLQRIVLIATHNVYKNILPIAAQNADHILVLQTDA